MSYRKPIKSPSGTSNLHNRPDAKANGAGPTALSPIDIMLRRAMRHAVAGEYQKTLDLLRSDGRNARVRNTRAVCLMRLGRHEEAIRVLRELVMTPGSTWMRAEAPTVHKINFATALLLGGHPNGCLDMLAEIKEPKHPSIVRLQAAVGRWVSSLSLWQKLNWWVYGIVPAKRPVTIDFLPGEFDVELSPAGPPNAGSPAPDMQTAV
jgi:hypothetical protein